MPTVIENQLGPLTFTVRLSDGRLWKQHQDHLRERRPDETEMVGAEQERPEVQLPPPLPQLTSTDMEIDAYITQLRDLYQTFHGGWILAFEQCVVHARTQKHTDRQRHKANRAYYIADTRVIQGKP